MIAPDGVAVCGTLGPSTQAALDTWLQRRAQRASSAAMKRASRWPWLALARSWSVALRRARRALAARQLADGPRRPARAPARVPGVRGPVGRRQQRAAVARDPRRHPAPDRGGPDRRARSAPYYVDAVQRADPADAVELGGIGLVAWVSRSLASARWRRHRVALRRWSRTPRLAATAEDEAIVRGGTRSAHEERDVTDDDDVDREELEAERDSCCARSTTSTPSCSPATSTPTRTATLHDDYTAARVGRDPVDRRRRGAQAADAPNACRAHAGRHGRRDRRVRVLAAVLLAHTVGQRRRARQITGDAQAKGSPTTDADS